MGGFAAITQNGDVRDIGIMMTAIRHRGPFIRGCADMGHVMIAQNYLIADTGVKVEAGEDPAMLDIPVSSDRSGSSRIGYDGQIGNWPDLARDLSVATGPCMDERLLLALFETYGHRMLDHLSDAVFAFLIADGNDFLAARDLLGIKTLFYGRKNRAVYFSSELKGLTAVCDDVNEFPAGHFMDRSGELHRFADFPEHPDIDTTLSETEAVERIRDIIMRSVNNRISWQRPTASLLSGGIDSSVVAHLANKAIKRGVGPGARLTTFALGVGVSEDIRNARTMAKFLDSYHHELIVDLEDLLAVLPEVIYHLESFDPSLVRSAAGNYLISRYAAEQGVEVLLSGEGGDEVFCGYQYLKRFDESEQYKRQLECLKFLHNNASLRLDRMNQCHSLCVVAPLISGELLSYALQLPEAFKQRPDGEDQRIEKYIFRKAFEGDLPDSIVWRLKQEFSQGSGSAGVLPAYFEEKVPDSELRAVQEKHPMVRSKEECYYFQLFTRHFGNKGAIKTVGQWITH